MFIGIFERAVERSNGRLSLPLSYCKALRSSISGVFVFPSLADPAIDVYAADRVERAKRSGEITGVPPEVVCSVLDGACRIQLDLRGRLVLPKRLRLHATIDTRAVIMGLGGYFRICAEGYLQDKEFDYWAQRSAIESFADWNMAG